MKIYVDENVKEKNIKYPCLMQFLDNGRPKETIVLFLSAEVGVRVAGGEIEYKDCWYPATDDYWQPFNGTITLSNEQENR